MPSPIYLDHHAATPLDPEVLAAMLPFLTGTHGNAASVGHRYGEAAREAIEMARKQVAGLLGMDSEDDAKCVVFSSGATEANNLAIKGVMAMAPAGSHFIVTAADHRSILDPAQTTARAGHSLTILPVDGDGCVSSGQIAAAITAKTVLVSAIFASNEVGSINDVLAIGAECRRRGVIFHTDAVQAAGIRPIDWRTAPIDLMSLSAHKLHGPQGIGALIVRRDEAGSLVRLAPLLEGGGQERRLRSGTVPTALAVGFGRACQLCRERMGADGRRIGELRDMLWRLLSDRIDGLAVNGSTASRLPGNLSIRVAGIKSEALLASLRDQVAASSGAACSTADPRPSHVLTAMGLSSDEIASTIRFGVGRFTTADEIERAAEAVIRAVRSLL